MKAITSVASLILASCSNAPQAKTVLDPGLAQRALTVASNYAVSHFDAPPCSDLTSHWRYNVHQNGRALVADIGPGDAKPPRVRIVMRENDLKIISASR